MRPFIHNGMCCLLALLIPFDPMIFQYLSTPDVRAAQEAQRDSGAGKKDNAPRPEDLKRMADEMERSFKALEAAEKEISRDTFDPKAIVDKVGRDPIKLFEWVRDNTFWAPYRGSLRGPTGVLMDRLGSSLDRALLLAELLRTAGHQVRLARADLSEEQAGRLIPRLRPVPDNPLPPTPPKSKEELDKLVEKFAKEYQFHAAAVHKNIDKNAFKAAKVAEELAQRVAEQAPAIAKAVGLPSKQDAEASRAREAADQLQALRDHWWVQRLDDKTWLDLDPLLADAQPGKQLIAAKEIITPDNKDGRFHLDGKYCHEIVIRIVVEQWKKEGLKEKTVLNQTLRPSELFGARIELNHYPMKWPKELDLIKEKKRLEKLKSTILAQDEWLPILTVGTDRFIQSSFTDSGDAIDAPLAPLLGGGAQKLGGNIGGILGGGKIGQTPGRKSIQESQLTAEWAEYEIRVPGQPVQKIRRQVFDILGPAARSEAKGAQLSINKEKQLERGLALMGQTEILTVACRLAPAYVQHLAMQNLLAFRAIVREALGTTNQADFKTLAEKATKLTPFPAQLYALCLARQGLCKFRDDIYINSPNILSFHQYSLQDPQADVVVCLSYDIVANEVGVRTAAAVDPFTIRLEQGIVDTNAEALITAGCGKVENTAEIFAPTDSQRTNWVTLRSLRDENWARVQLPADVRARIREDLAAGYTVMVPERPIARDGRMVSGWWRVNPRTGQSLGMGSQGWGNATTELLLVLVVVIATFGMILCAAMSIPEGDYRMGFLCFVGVAVCALAVPIAVVMILLEPPGGIEFAHGAELICGLLAGLAAVQGALPR